MTELLKKILIVEDEEMIAKPLTMKLRLSGFEVVNASDGGEALTMLAHDKYDLILLDLMMPEVDGFSVLAELQKKGDKTPVIVATNLNSPEDVSRVFELGCTNYYVKADTSLDQIVENARKTIK
jgi:Response regulators consisting of a CheY-like receiver domain and a winged-helix DNA-binding domain